MCGEMASKGFKFGFVIDDESQQLPGASNSTALGPVPVRNEQRRRTSFNFIGQDDPSSLLLLMREHMSQNLDSSETLQLNGAEALVRIRNPIRTEEAIYEQIEKGGTDIIPGRYEGGLKVWECSLDLCRYIWNQRHCLDVRYALELGCGHGLPGCLILRIGLQNDSITKILFTDFNDFVIHDVTLPNILLNTYGIPVERVANSVVLGAGDWLEMSSHLRKEQHEFPQLPKDGRFDLILAAETTYTAETSEDTAVLLAKHLAIDGVGLVATKRYYFGCGGGSDAFRDASSTQQVSIEGISYGLRVETVEVFASGSGNIRELLSVVLQAIP